MAVQRFIKYVKNLLPSNETPKGFFERQYDAQALQRLSRERRRSDLFDLSSLCSTSQEYCEQLADHLCTLLKKEERHAVGDFHIGLSDEANLSCTVEPLGGSFLILIHRRLFNALRFLTDVYSSSILSTEEKVILLSEYTFAITSEGLFLLDLPLAPSRHSRYEAEEATLLNGNLMRFLIGHELYHMLPPLVGDFNTSPLPPKKRLAWESECKADYFSVTLMLREQNSKTALLSRYRTAAMQAPILFLTFLDTIECLRSTSTERPPITRITQSHPDASMREMTLSVNLKKNFPKQVNLLRDTKSTVQPLFKQVQDYISENMTQRRAR